MLFPDITAIIVAEQMSPSERIAEHIARCISIMGGSMERLSAFVRPAEFSCDRLWHNHGENYYV
ncbi:MAG: hypothetical protein P4L53_03770 [Candidatus Obscuribacterales bacterium]|nr:hypothetical protein [Candidatus Obscuribacterales bacterium]